MCRVLGIVLVDEANIGLEYLEASGILHTTKCTDQHACAQLELNRRGSSSPAAAVGGWD